MFLSPKKANVDTTGLHECAPSPPVLAGGGCTAGRWARAGSAPVRYAILPLDCHCNSGVNSWYLRGELPAGSGCPLPSHPSSQNPAAADTQPNSGFVSDHTPCSDHVRGIYLVGRVRSRHQAVTHKRGSTSATQCGRPTSTMRTKSAFVTKPRFTSISRQRTPPSLRHTARQAHRETRYRSREIHGVSDREEATSCQTHHHGIDRYMACLAGRSTHCSE
jgi:hypothetical protein